MRFRQIDAKAVMQMTAACLSFASIRLKKTYCQKRQLCCQPLVSPKTYSIAKKLLHSAESTISANRRPKKGEAALFPDGVSNPVEVDKSAFEHCRQKVVGRSGGTGWLSTELFATMEFQQLQYA